MASPDRIIDVFHEAKAMSAGPERDAFLEEACKDDPQTKEQVLSLLRANDSAGNFMGVRPAITPDIEAELLRLKPEGAGERIGPYKLREQIGEGGFGVVWVAEQKTPMRRTVALKVIKLGMDTKEVVARFEQERHALAMMDHPNIAKVLDAGATEHGRPYFVMELVRGIKITDYCDQANLPTAERLELFIQVCHAVQHAHQKGIIHRDLKPSNVLVTLHDGVPIPKIIDFGVAKATQGRLGELSIYTRFEQLIGTPLYMSPEQAEMSGLDVDTRADIYALGVLLYELLTGRTPFDAAAFTKAGHDEMRRIIREEEPPRPSTALDTMAQATLTTVAQHRASEPPKLIHSLRGDLDWIVMKTLEKDRSRRYETASGLAADIQRYLANEPVLASPPSVTYRLRKLARRHLPTVIAASLIFLALVAGLVATTWSMMLAHRAELKAAAEQRDGAKQLYASLVAQARATRFSGQPGRRFESLDLLRRAREMAKDLHLPEDHLRTLRREYTAALAIPDTQLGAPWTNYPTDTVASDFDESLTICAMTNRRGDCSIRRIGSDTDLYRIPGRGGAATVSLSQDAKYLLVHHWENRDPILTCDIWELGLSAPKRILTESKVRSTSFRNSELIALGYNDGTIRVFNLSEAKEVHHLRPQNLIGEIQLALHPFEPLVAVGSYIANGVEIRDLRNGEIIHFLPQDARVSSVAWTPDGRSLAIGFAEAKRVGFYRRDTWESESSIATLQAVTSIAFSRSGNVLAVNGWEGILEVYDLPSATRFLKTWTRTIGDPRFSSDGLRLSAAVRDGRLGIFQVSAPNEVRHLVAHEMPPGGSSGQHSFHPGGRLLAVSMIKGVVFLDLFSNRQVGFIPSSDRNVRVLFENSGDLLTSSINGVARWPITPAPNTDDTFDIGISEQLPLSMVENFAQSHDSRVIATVNRTVNITAHLGGAWVLRADKPDAPLRLDPGADMGSVAVSPDGRWVVTGTHGAGVIKLWNAQTGEFVRELIPRDAAVPRFTNDGRWLITAGSGGQIISTESWAPVRSSNVSALRASPDNRLGAEVHENGIRLINLTSGEEVAFLERSGFENLADLSFSPNGNLLVLQDRFGEFEGWNLALIRERLKEVDLDWNWPPMVPAPPSPPVSAAPLKLRFRGENSRL